MLVSETPISPFEPDLVKDDDYLLFVGMMVVAVDPPFGRHFWADFDTGRLTPAFDSNT